MAEGSQASSIDVINIKIKTMEPATYDIKVPEHITVAKLKELLVDMANLPTERQRIIYKGRVLENDQQLSSHGVQEGHTLHLVERVPRPPPQAAGQPAEPPGQRGFAVPIAMGSLELDSDETDVNALMANIFQQLGGQGQMAGFMPGDGGNDTGEDGQHRRAQEAQFIAQQLMDSIGLGSNGWGGAPGERPPNMLASIQSYLNRTQELMQNPTVLLPSLPDPPAPENELREQRRLMDAVRGILTSSVQLELGSEQQAFLQDQSSWQPPAPPAGSSSRQSTASGVASAQTAEPAGSSVAAASAAHTSSNAQASDATQRQSLTAAASAGAGVSVTGAAAASQQPARRQQQPASSDNQSASGNRQDAAAGGSGRNADGRRQRRTRRPAISPVVTMALGSLLQSTLQGDAYRDPAGVLTNAAQLLLNSHSFEGDNRQQVLDSLRTAGSHLYRLAPLLLELARAFSGAVAAMQGHPGPLALNPASYIRPDGSAPAIGHTPSGAHPQVLSSSVSIPMFPGMPMGGLHIGPEAPGPSMTAPTTAPAANGPTGPTSASSTGTSASTRGTGTAPSAEAGVGQEAGRRQGMGLNQALGIALQPFLSRAGGQPGRPAHGVAMTESRQVIQVPGAPPISIRFGARPVAPQRPSEAQQAQPEVPVTLQIGDGTPVSLTPAIQAVSSMLASALQSALASASSPTAASAAPVASGSRQPAQQQHSTATAAPASSGTAGGPPTPSSLLTPPVTQQVLRALMHVISPLVNGQGAPAASAATAAAASASQADRATPVVTHPAAGGAGRATPSSAARTASSAAATPSDNSRGNNRPAAPRPLGLSEPLSEMIGGDLGTSGAGVAAQGAGEEDVVSMLMRAGASSVGVSGPMAMPTQQQPRTTSATRATPSDSAPRPTATSPPPASAETAEATPVGDQPSSKPAALPSASAAASGSGGTRPSWGAMGLGSALPPREKGTKKSHPRSPVPVASSYEADSSRQVGSRPGPSNTQDNVKRARHGDTNPDAPSTSAAEGAASVSAATGTDAGVTQAGGEAEEIPRPPRGAVQAGSAGGLDAMLAQMFGGGDGATDGGGSVGLNLNSLVQGAGHSPGPAAGQGASGPLGALMQSIAPMMQQLMVGSANSANGQGLPGAAHTRGGMSDWKSDLSELDGAEQAEWEQLIREDLQKQKELPPQRYQDHSTAYLAGRPPSAKSTLLPENSALVPDQEDSD